MTDNRSVLAVFAPAAIAFAAIVSFSATSVLRFADPDWIYAGGFVLASGVASLWVSDVIGGGKKAFAIGLALAVAGFGILSWQGLRADGRASMMHAPCRALATEMLLDRSRREADAAAFQALDCGFSVRGGDLYLPGPDEPGQSRTAPNPPAPTATPAPR